MEAMGGYGCGRRDRSATRLSTEPRRRGACWPGRRENDGAGGRILSGLRRRKPVTFASVIGAGLLMATAAFADPYNPGERALGGGLLRPRTGALTGPLPRGRPRPPL